MGEIKSLTGLRGLAAIYVFTFHFFGWMLSITNISFETKSILFRAGYTFLNHGYISVDVFFMLSGFVLCLSSGYLFHINLKIKNYLIFMKKRFSRLYPLYFFFTTLSFILFYQLSDLKVYLYNLTLLQCLLLLKKYSIVDQAWSLSTEWLLYLVFPLLIFLFLKKVNQ